ncbi:hypothetical protein FOA52_012291 [Chlamydomonas sp. UWO 241]|nr:hypothetical protein FOA52_012291 [Chlamydomonas sp. UWO 241]
MDSEEGGSEPLSCSEEDQSEEESEEEDSYMVGGYGAEAEDTGHHQASSSAAIEFSIITGDDIEAKQSEAAEATMELLGCKLSAAQSILMQYRWDRERVASDMVDKGPEHVFAAAGVLNVAAGGVPGPSGDFLCCDICCTDTISDAATTMDCGHTFCNDCWAQHFKTQISEGKACGLRKEAGSCQN